MQPQQLQQGQGQGQGQGQVQSVQGQQQDGQQLAPSLSAAPNQLVPPEQLGTLPQHQQQQQQQQEGSAAVSQQILGVDGSRVPMPGTLDGKDSSQTEDSSGVSSGDGQTFLAPHEKGRAPGSTSSTSSSPSSALGAAAAAASAALSNLALGPNPALPPPLSLKTPSPTATHESGSAHCTQGPPSTLPPGPAPLGQGVANAHSSTGSSNGQGISMVNPAPPCRWPPLPWNRDHSSSSSSSSCLSREAR